MEHLKEGKEVAKDENTEQTLACFQGTANDAKASEIMKGLSPRHQVDEETPPQPIYETILCL
jgi:hypothetical protein